MTSTQLIDQGRMQADSAPALQDDIDDESFSNQQVAYRSSLPFITPAMHAFAEHWAHNRNQVKAFQHAYPGSSTNSARLNARRLFADDRVQLEIRRVIESWSEKSGITIAQLEHELTRLGRSDVRNLFDEAGNIRPPHEWDADTAAAVSSYVEEEHWEGRGEDRMLVKTRKVRLAEKHGPLRTLLEAKGAFEKQKAPPGAAAIFNINLGGVPLQLGAPVIEGRTITMQATKQKLLKQPASGAIPPIHIAQAPHKQPKGRKQTAKERSHASRTRAARAGRHDKAPESVDISSVSASNVIQVTKEAQTATIPTVAAKPPLF